jgi:peptide/nickel transport system substrate-binding protein
MSEINYDATGTINVVRLQSSRREFLKTAAVLGLSVPVLNALGGNQARAAEPKKGGTLRLGMEGGSASDTFDPTTIADPIPITLALCVFNGLIEYDANGNPGGELLESWEAKPGAAEWVFNVRKNITFSNGKTLDADDIIYSINLHRG